MNLSLYHRSKNEGVIKMEQVTLAKRFDLNQNKDLDFFLIGENHVNMDFILYLE